jgi:glutathione S-transferase
MLKIWGRRNSANVQKVLWMAAELELAFEQIDAGRGYGVTDQDSYAAMNPNRLVPTIQLGDFTLWESNTITRFLANQYDPTGRLYPKEPRPRAEVERWMDWHQSLLQPTERPVFFGIVRTEPGKQDWPAIRAAVKPLAAAWSILNDHLAERAYVGGERFTVGDIPVGISAHRWFAMTGFERPNLPHLAAWYARLAERQGYRTYVKFPLS